MERRDFFHLVATAAGGMVLASCANDGTGPLDPTRPPIPNGMQFYPVKNSGSSLPDGGILNTLRLDSTIDGVGEIYYGALDAGGVPGLYGVTVDFSGSTPTTVSERKILRAGDSVRSGYTVKYLYQYDVNASGGLAMLLAELPDNGPTVEEHSIYFDRTKSGFKRLLYDGLELPGGYQLQGRFSDVDVHTNDDILVAGHVRIPRPHGGHIVRTEIREAIIYFPAASPSAAHVVTTAREIPGVQAGRGRFGLLDMSDGGVYVTQGTIGTTGYASSTAEAPSLGESQAPLTQTTVLTGEVYGSGPSRAARQSLTGLLRGGTAPAGTAFYGPRIGTDGATAFVIHETDLTMVLYYRGEREMETGDLTPRGNTVRYMYPPVLGPQNEAYVLVGTNHGQELMVINGTDRRTLLGHGDKLTGDDRSVIGIVIGHSTTAVDADGHLALVVCFADTSAAVAVGVPR